MGCLSGGKWKNVLFSPIRLMEPEPEKPAMMSPPPTLMGVDEESPTGKRRKRGTGMGQAQHPSILALAKGGQLGNNTFTRLMG